MYFHFQKLNDKDEESAVQHSEVRGILKIEVPHWSAQVQIFDDSFNPVAGAEKINADPKSSSGYSTETSLPSGVYQIKTSLEGKTESEWVPVRPDRVTKVTSDAWETLEFTSATPLGQIKNARKTQINAAERMSRQLTWKKSVGDAGLFLFVRTSNPQKYGQTFTEGLELLDEHGKLVTDFSENVKRSENEGWMAFNADLPGGSYILRRKRRGVNLRHQVLHLCPNWQIEVFIQSRRYSSLGTMNVNMKRHREFTGNSEAAEAAEAVLNFLRYKTDVRVLLNSDKLKNDLDVLLDAETGNPWLGVLAAYAILRLEEEFGGSSSDGNSAAQNQSFEEYFSLLHDQLIPFLKREIPGHPDVKALLIDENPESLSFSFPPMLWLSLRRIQNRATRYANIIPTDSLTDCVIDNPLADSPWTAWKFLERYPADFEKSAKAVSRTKKTLTQLWEKTKNLAVDFAIQTLAADDDFAPQFQTDESAALTAEQKKLQHVSVIQAAKKIVQDFVESGEIGNIPEELEINLSEQINQILGQVKAEDFSIACNIPLSRAESGLDDLKKQSETLSQSGQFDDAPVLPAASNKKVEMPLGQAIISYAVNQVNQLAEIVSAASEDSRIHEKPPVKIENLVSEIRASAERLWLVNRNTGETASGSPNVSQQSSEPPTAEVVEFAQTIALHLKNVSESLLSRTDFIVMTDSQHKIFDKNDAFLFLLLPPTLGTSSSDTLVGDLAEKQVRWETALGSLPFGDSEIKEPTDENSEREYFVKRTFIEDKQTNLQAYLNIIRRKNVKTLDDKILDEINAVLSNLTLFTSLFVYGTFDAKHECIEKLKDIDAQLADLMKM